MRTRLKISIISLTTWAVLECASLQAGPVTNWHTFKATTATTLSGQGTANPVFGSVSLPSSTAFLIGYFNAMSLTNLGDSIRFSYQMSFTDAGGMSSPGDNFRFALYDLNGQPHVTAENTAAAGVAGYTDHWRGYWFGNRGGGGAGANGTIRKRYADNTHPLANAGTRILAYPTGNIILASSTEPEGGPVYTALMALEKTPGGVTIAGYLYGNGDTNLFAFTDDGATDAWPVNYGAVGYLNANPLNCDQVNFQDVAVTYSLSNALQVVTPPANVQVTAPQPATFTVAWSGSGLLPTLQWREDSGSGPVDIPDATNATYTIPATSVAQSGNTYSVLISNVFGDNVTSSSATLTVVADTTAPIVLSASSLLPGRLNVIFSEPVDPTTAQDAANFTLAGNTYSAVTLVGTTNVEITVDTPISGNYTLSVSNVQDVAGNPVAGTNVAGIAHGWQDAESILITNGMAYAMNDKVVLYADGLNIYTNEDHFQYVYRTVSGDFDLAVRVESLLQTDNNARAGLMARPDTFYDSPNVLIEATPGRFIFQYRTNAAEATLTVPSPRPPTAYPDCWIRLVRSGSVFTGYSSTNHGVWDLIGSFDTAVGAVAYPTDVLVGLVASAGNAGLTTRAQFSDFGQALVLVRPTLAVAPSGGEVEVSWGTNSIGFTLQAAPSLSGTITWTNVPGSSVTNRVFVPASAGPLYFRAIYPGP